MKSDCRPTMSGQTKRHTISIRPAPSSRVAATSHSLCFLLPCSGRDLATSRFTIASPHGDFCAAAPPSTVCRSVVARLVIEHVTSTQARRKAIHTSCAVPEAKRDGAVEDTRQILVGTMRATAGGASLRQSWMLLRMLLLLRLLLRVEVNSSSDLSDSCPRTL